MTKNEVLSYLEKRLEILNKQEREDVLAEFSQHIDNKIQSGLSEEEAIKDFGNVDEFADDILAAYKVDPEYNHRRVNFEYTISRWLKKFGKIVNAVADELLSMDRGGVCKLLVKLLVICLCLFVVRLPLDMIANILERTFSFLPYFLDNFCSSLVNFSLSIVYIVVVCYTIYIFIKKTFLLSYDFDQEVNQEMAEKHQDYYGGDFQTDRNKKGKEYKVKMTKDSDGIFVGIVKDELAVKENSIVDANVIDVVGTDVNDFGLAQEEYNQGGSNEFKANKSKWINLKKSDKSKNQNKEQQNPANKNNKAKSSAGEWALGGVLVNLFVICLKILVVFLMLPVAIFALGTIVAFGVLVALTLQGVPVFGPLLIAAGTMLCLIVFVVGVLRVIFGGGATNEKVV